MSQVLNRRRVAAASASIGLPGLTARAYVNPIEPMPVSPLTVPVAFCRTWLRSCKLGTPAPIIGSRPPAGQMANPIAHAALTGPAGAGTRLVTAPADVI